MNQKAKSLGIKNTHFTNPTGLDPIYENISPNYSTAKELIKLSKYILENNPLIFEISLKKGPYLIKNGLSSLYFSSNQEVVGGKTGYTEKAGGCMIVILKNEKDNIFINVILGADYPQERIQEMQKLIDLVSI
ncbi:MAG: serine-type D-Ala-D-Ala carboxypeptidase, partial [Patescibacteria group bacterium]|nr:serine-type D-Ala-D-Ala carboxypeptidase [Patescibacteria group bacterium]